MNKLIQHIRRADKRKLFIYLFSFLIFLTVNNLVSNLFFLLNNDDVRLNFWFEHSITCTLSVSGYVLFFLGLKTLLFVIFFILIKRYPDKLFTEFFIAYFIYDFVYILAIIWDLALPMNPHLALTSSPQTFLDSDFIPYLCLIVSALWAIFLFIALYKQKRLSIIYLFNRLVIIPFSVVLICFSIAVIFYYTRQYQTHYYHVYIGKYYNYPEQVFNITTQEVIKAEPSKAIIIKFPTRVDSITFYDRNGDMHRDTSTSSYFTVQRIEDTISGTSIDSLIDSKIRVGYSTPIEIRNSSWCQKVKGFKMEVLFPDGTSYYNYIEGNKISLDKEAIKEIRKNINNSYIVIGTVFFLNDKGEEMKVNNNVAWKIKSSP